MTDKNIQMSQRNADNTEWENLFPITKESNVQNLVSDLTSINSQLSTKMNTSYITDTENQPVTFLNGASGIGGYRAITIGSYQMIILYVYNLSFQGTGTVLSIPNMYAPSYENYLLSPASNGNNNSDKDCAFVLATNGNLNAYSRSGWANTDTHSFSLSYFKTVS